MMGISRLSVICKYFPEIGPLLAWVLFATHTKTDVVKCVLHFITASGLPVMVEVFIRPYHRELIFVNGGGRVQMYSPPGEALAYLKWTILSHRIKAPPLSCLLCTHTPPPAPPPAPPSFPMIPVSLVHSVPSHPDHMTLWYVYQRSLVTSILFFSLK